MKKIALLILILGYTWAAGCRPIVTPTMELPAVATRPVEVPQATTPQVATATVATVHPTTEQGIPVHLQQIHFTGAFDGFAIGIVDNTHRLLKTRDGGKSWSDITPAEEANLPVTEVETLMGAFRGSGHIWLAKSIWPGTPNGENRVMVTTDGGQSWFTSDPLDQTSQFESFSISHLLFIDDQTGWLMAHVGAGMNHDYIAIYQTKDGGHTWHPLMSPFEDSSGIQACQKNGLWFTDANHGWLTGSCNGVAPGVLLFRTRDGGKTWGKIELPVPAGYDDLFAMGSGYCGSNPIRRGDTTRVEVEIACRQITPTEEVLFFLAESMDGGDTWTVVPKGQTSQYIYTVDPNVVVDLGGEWKRSMDGGSTWQLVNVEDGWKGYGIQLEAPDSNQWYVLTWATSGTALAYSQDQGTTWQWITPFLLEKAFD